MLQLSVFVKFNRLVAHKAKPKYFEITQIIAKVLNQNDSAILYVHTKAVMKNKNKPQEDILKQIKRTVEFCSRFALCYFFKFSTKQSPTPVMNGVLINVSSVNYYKWLTNYFRKSN